MLFREIGIIEQVDRAGFSGDSLVYIDKSGNVTVKDSQGARVIARNRLDFRVGMGFIFCFTRENNLEVYKKDKLINEFAGPFAVRPFFDNGDWVVILQEEEGKERFIRFDTELHAVPYEWSDIYPREIKGDYFFVRQRQDFSCHRLTEGEELWRLNVGEVTEGNEIIDQISYGDKLFLGLDIGAVICLDVTTGKIIEKIPLDKGRIKLYEGLIYGVGGQEASVLNPETLQWHTIDFSAALKEQELSFLPGLFIPRGDEIYFKDYDRPKVGLVKLSTQELLWQTEISIAPGNYWIEDMGANENKLFVLAQGGTLRVFEKNT